MQGIDKIGEADYANLISESIKTALLDDEGEVYRLELEPREDGRWQMHVGWSPNDREDDRDRTFCTIFNHDLTTDEYEV